MRKRFASMMLAGMALVAPEVRAQTTVIDFESFGGACDNVRPNMFLYSGIDFLGQWTCYGFTQAPYTARSGVNRVYAVQGGVNGNFARFRLTSTSAFVGAWFAGLSNNVFFRLFAGNALVHTSGGSGPQTATPTFLASGYTGAVDSVEVVGTDVGWVMDDLTITANVTPEPATMFLLATGLAGAGAAARKRRRKV